MNLDVDIKRKATVRVSRKDLQKLLAENEQMAEQITALQNRMNELLEENRRLRVELDDFPEFKPDKTPVEPEPYDPDDDNTFPDYNPPHPHIDPNIYFDGSNGLRNGPRFK